MRLAQAHGWKGEAEFRVAMMMHVNGVTVSEAQALYADAKKRLQDRQNEKIPGGALAGVRRGFEEPGARAVVLLILARVPQTIMEF